MTYYSKDSLLDRLKNLFNEMDRLTWWQRLLQWGQFKRDHVEGAREDLHKLQFIQENSELARQNFEKAKEELAIVKADLKVEHDNATKLSEQIREQEKKIAALTESCQVKDKRILQSESKVELLQEKMTELETVKGKYSQAEQLRRKEQAEHLKILQKSTETADKTREQLLEEDRKLNEERTQNRTRAWKDHQDRTEAQLLGLCQSRDYQFNFYTDQEPPAELADAKLKPDFIVELFDEYIVFDSKSPTTTNSDFNEYLKTQAKSSVKKYEKAAQYIHKSVFFVVPTLELEQIKDPVINEGNYKFHIISPEAIEPILANYKKIQGYEVAEKLNPEDRDELINLIARYDNHIMRRNQIDLFLIDHGFKTIDSKSGLPEDMREAVEAKNNIELVNPTPQRKRQKITIESLERDHQKLIERAKLDHLKPVAEIEVQEEIQEKD